MYEQIRAGNLAVKTADNELRSRLASAEGKTDGRKNPRPADPTTNRGALQAEAHKRRLVEVVSTVTGFSRGIDLIHVDHAAHAMNPGEMKALAASLTDALHALRGLRNTMKEHA
jgi:hypothetical protein